MQSFVQGSPGGDGLDRHTEVLLGYKKIPLSVHGPHVLVRLPGAPDSRTLGGLFRTAPPRASEI